MKLIQTKLLFDGSNEKKNCFIGIEGNEIKFVGHNQPSGTHEIIEHCEAVTPSFIDAHSHIGMVRAENLLTKKKPMNIWIPFLLYLMLCIVYIWMIPPFKNLLNQVFYIQ